MYQNNGQSVMQFLAIKITGGGVANPASDTALATSQLGLGGAK